MTHQESDVGDRSPFAANAFESALIAQFVALRTRVFAMDTNTGVSFARAGAAGWKRFTWFGLAEACQALHRDIQAVSGRPCWWLEPHQVEGIRIRASLLTVQLAGVALESRTRAVVP
jgi:hypothetical protein